MSTLINQLITDHKNLTRLLNILDDQVKAFMLNSNDEENDFSVLLETLDYLNAYPQKWHHPAEDLILNFLLEKDLNKEDKDSIKTILKQHQVLEKETKKLEELFLSITNDAIIPMRRISEQFFSYLDLQREHIETENHLVFPIMEQNITESEWQSLQGKLSNTLKDPLFQTRIKSEYNILYRYLDNSN